MPILPEDEAINGSNPFANKTTYVAPVGATPEAIEQAEVSEGWLDNTLRTVGKVSKSLIPFKDTPQYFGNLQIWYAENLKTKEGSYSLGDFLRSAKKYRSSFKPLTDEQMVEVDADLKETIDDISQSGKDIAENNIDWINNYVGIPSNQKEKVLMDIAGAIGQSVESAVVYSGAAVAGTAGAIVAGATAPAALAIAGATTGASTVLGYFGSKSSSSRAVELINDGIDINKLNAEAISYGVIEGGTEAFSNLLVAGKAMSVAKKIGYGIAVSGIEEASAEGLQKGTSIAFGTEQIKSIDDANRIAGGIVYSGMLGAFGGGPMAVIHTVNQRNRLADLYQAIEPNLERSEAVGRANDIFSEYADEGIKSIEESMLNNLDFTYKTLNKAAYGMKLDDVETEELLRLKNIYLGEKLIDDSDNTTEVANSILDIEESVIKDKYGEEATIIDTISGEYQEDITTQESAKKISYEYINDIVSRETSPDKKLSAIRNKINVISSKIDNIEDTKAYVETLKESINYVSNELNKYRNRISKGDGTIDEYNSLPRYFRAKESPVKIDTLANEMQLPDGNAVVNYLNNLYNERIKLKKDISYFNKELAKEINIKEIDYLKNQLNDLTKSFEAGFKEGKDVGIKEGVLRERMIAKHNKRKATAFRKAIIDFARENLERQDLKYVLRLVRKDMGISGFNKAIAKIEQIASERKESNARKEAIKIITKPVSENVFADKANEIEELRRELDIQGTDTNSLIELAQKISDLSNEGKVILKNLKEQRKIAYDIAVAATVNSITPGTLNKTLNELTIPLNLIEKIFGNNKFAKSVFYNSIHTADTVYSLNKADRIRRIYDVLNRNNLSVPSLAKSVVIGGQSFKVDNLLSIYVFSKNDKSYQALRYGNELSSETIKEVVNYVNNNKSLKDVANTIQSIVDEKFTSIYDRLLNVYNVTTKKVSNYFPMYRNNVIAQYELENKFNNDEDFEGSFLRSHFALELATEMKDVTTSQRTGVNKSFTIERLDLSPEEQKKVGGLSLTFIHDAEKAVHLQEKFLAFAAVNKAINNILSNKSLQKGIRAKGEGIWEMFESQLKDSIRGFNLKNPPVKELNMNMLERVASNFEKAVYVTYLGGNALTVFKNIPAVYQALPYTSVTQINASFFSMIESMATDNKLVNKIFEMEPSLKDRVIESEISDVLQESKDTTKDEYELRTKQLIRMVGSASMRPLLKVDQLTVLSIYDAVFQSSRKKGFGINESKQIALEAVIKTQPSGKIKDKPSLYRQANAIARLTLLFSNALNKIWNSQLHDIPQFVKSGDLDKAFRVQLGLMISGFFIYWASRGFDKEIIEKMAEEPREWIAALFGQNLSSVPFIGNDLLRAVEGKKYLRGGITPINDIFYNSQRVINNVSEGEYFKGMTDLISSISVASGVALPYNQIDRMLDGANFMLENQTIDLRHFIWSKEILEDLQ